MAVPYATFRDHDEALPAQVQLTSITVSPTADPHGLASPAATASDVGASDGPLSPNDGAADDSADWGEKPVEIPSGLCGLLKFELIPYCDCPHWCRDNDHIVAGYRKPTNSFRACIHSMFQMHNETVNIWTALGGTLLSLSLFAYTLSRNDLHSNDKTYISIYCLSAAGCLFSSCLFHVFLCYSARWYDVLLKLDLAGINLLIGGSVTSVVYVFFYDEAHYTVRVVYVVSILVLSGINSVVSFLPHFTEPSYRKYRVALFTCTASAGLIPLLHGVAVVGTGDNRFVILAAFGFATGGLYLSGAAVYATRVPERWYPGKFDIWLSSHQIWHLFVIAASFTFYAGVAMAVDEINRLRSRS